MSSICSLMDYSPSLRPNRNVAHGVEPEIVTQVRAVAHPGNVDPVELATGENKLTSYPRL